MTLIGLLWAALAPISLIILWGLLYKVMKKSKLTRPQRIGLSVGLVAVPVLALWIPARLEYARACQINGAPTILKTAQVDGFFLDDSTANSFGMRYLQEEGFTWMEANSIYNRGKFTRYEKTGDQITQKEIDQLTAQYVLKTEFKEFGSYSDSEMTISDRSTGEKMAWAHSMHFDGGPAKWVLGAWGVSSCPGAWGDSSGFRKMYHLAKDTLRPSKD